MVISLRSEAKEVGVWSGLDPDLYPFTLHNGYSLSELQSLHPHNGNDENNTHLTGTLWGW